LNKAKITHLASSTFSLLIHINYQIGVIGKNAPLFLRGNNMSERKEKRDALFPEITRRGLLKASSALVTLPFVMSGKSFAAKSEAATTAEAAGSTARVVQTCSTFDCGGKCDIRAHVADGVVTQITTRPDSALDPEMPVMRACVRGRSYRKFVYHPDRLKYPMKRVGKRGEGKFERISWDEATTLIADNLQRITAKYGPESRFVHNNASSSGEWGHFLWR